jgi:hypothetical protein
MELILSIITLLAVVAFGFAVLSKLSELVAVLRNIDKNLVEAGSKLEKRGA